MTNNRIAVILQSVSNEFMEAMKMERILTLQSHRYMVFSSDNGFYFMKMNINDMGFTEFNDITDDFEFKLVSESYRALVKSEE